MATDAMPALADEQVEAFHREGFLALPRFTDPAELEEIERVLMPLFARFHELPERHAVDLGVRAHHGGRLEIAEINYTTELVPELARTRTYLDAQRVAQELLQSPVIHTGYDHAILKPAGCNRVTPWHQDQAYTRDRTRDALGSVHLWIPLHDVSIAMGCMWFAPRTHRGPVLPHHRREERACAHALQATKVDTAGAVACPLPAGGLTAHFPRTLHYAGPNRTDRPRLAWILEFGRPRTARLSRRARAARWWSTFTERVAPAF
jgi:phytanoyl-CoA dioxygenase PhyH